MNCRGADPYIFFDPKSQLYYIYATDAEKEKDGQTFIIYKTKDLTHLEYVGHALDIRYNQWGKDWFWAPIVVYNPNNELYYMFYSARVKDELLEKYFHNPHFEEGCKLGVATSKSPEGPFRNISNEPIDYNPYDSNYLNIEEISENPSHPTLSFQEAFDRAKRGTYIPIIDIDIFFENDHLYFYFSRCCYKNYVFDNKIGKFVEESHILCAEFDPEFWFDKKGQMMPQVMPYMREGDKDSYYELIAYWREPQDWENAHINDFDKYQGMKKNRRWSEGSTIFKKVMDGETMYLMTYSCNNYENEHYGVGISRGKSPWGPFAKYQNNPIIHQIEEQHIYSTGHGSYINIDGKDYYIFHMRDSKEADRCIAWCELYISNSEGISISPIHKCELINH